MKSARRYRVIQVLPTYSYEKRNLGGRIQKKGSGRAVPHFDGRKRICQLSSCDVCSTQPLLRFAKVATARRRFTFVVQIGREIAIKHHAVRFCIGSVVRQFFVLTRTLRSWPTLCSVKWEYNDGEHGASPQSSRAQNTPRL